MHARGFMRSEMFSKQSLAGKETTIIMDNGAYQNGVKKTALLPELVDLPSTILPRLIHREPIGSKTMKDGIDQTSHHLGSFYLSHFSLTAHLNECACAQRGLRSGAKSDGISTTEFKKWARVCGEEGDKRIP
eukprot:747126-Hanusia_phi.AAC.5